MFSLCSLEVVMDDDTEDKTSISSSTTLVAKATSIKIFREPHADLRCQQFIAAMVPHSMVESSLGRTVYGEKASEYSKRNSSNNEENQSRRSKCMWLGQEDRLRLSRDLLPRIHSVFKTNSQHQQQHTPSILIRAIFSTTGMENHSPADMVLMDIPTSRHKNNSVDPSEILQTTNGECILAEPHAVLKLLIISQVHIASTPTTFSSQMEIPRCPVCLHRIDPARLGLPRPLNHQLCSKFCAASPIALDLVGKQTSPSSPSVVVGCPKQSFLNAWPEPSHCIACKVIRDYHTVGAAAATHSIMTSANCNKCALNKTLWVCLICGFCGCGRYSNKHAEAHFLHSGHSYSLELATLRIWDYANGGEFANRGDLLECPAGRQQRARSLQIQHQIADGTAAAMASTSSARDNNRIITSDQWDQHQAYYWYDHGDDKSPKKAIMIGEEYEALLQSALEDQAQHYQGEISRLRAELTAEQVHMDSLTTEEAEAIKKLKSEISELRVEADVVSRDLLDAQAQEAGHRADSKRLLREQQVAQDLLKAIQEETRREEGQGRMQVEELEQQIVDLTANLQMRHQFSQDQELTNAHIFGTMPCPDQARASSKKGKYRRLLGRK